MPKIETHTAMLNPALLVVDRALAYSVLEAQKDAIASVGEHGNQFMVSKLTRFACNIASGFIERRNMREFLIAHLDHGLEQYDAMCLRAARTSEQFDGEQPQPEEEQPQ